MQRSTRKLTQDQTKLHNRQLVLRIIYESAVSRADIARATGLTRTTTSQAVAELMEEGLVADGGQGPSAGGKPPRLLHIVDDARYAIGVDVSGYEVQGSVFDLRGRVVHHLSLPMPSASGGAAGSENGDSALNLVYRLLDQLIAAADRPLLGMGLGVPGFLDAQQGIIHQAVNLGWHELPLGDLLKQRYDLPVYLVNDSQAATLAQYTFGNDNDDREDLAVLLVDRGISAGLVVHGELYLGGGYSGASEIGHLCVVEGGELCACGHYGCLETVASQGAVLRRAKTLYANHPDSKLRQFAPDAAAVDMEAFIRACQAGDESLAQLVSQIGHYLSIAVSNLVTVANIPAVVLAGSVAGLGDDLVQAITSEMQQRLLSMLAERTRVKVSELGEEIIMLGASALPLANELGIV